MSPSDPSPSEALLARLLAELDRTPAADRPAVVARYLAAHPDHAAAIRDLIDADAGVRPPAEAPPARRLEPGQRLGPFRVVRFVAQGGMGEVYEAVQDVLDRRVALKVVRHGFVSPTARARFLREQQVLARLHQTNIVPVHHAGEDGDVQFCAMQFVDGVSLHVVVTELFRQEASAPGIRQTPPIGEVAGSLLRGTTHTPAGPAAERTTELSPAAADPAAPPAAGPALTLSPSYFASAAAVMIQVAGAVQHGHDHGVCHRDIKPSNLLIDPDGTCWVIDYGLAGVANAAAAPAAPDGPAGKGVLTQGPLGTPRYMAPEQFEGRTDPRADVWSLGVTLYELLTLRPAFPAVGWAATRDAVTTTEPAEPRGLVRNVPADLAAVARKAMAKDPAARYPTAAALADDLRRWLGWEPTAVRPGWWTLRPLRLWAWRRKAWATATATFFLALVAGLGLESARAEKRTTDAEREKEKRETTEELLGEREKQRAAAAALAEARQEQLAAIEKQQARERALVKLQKLRLGERESGWAGGVVRELESLNRDRPGDDLRDQATAALIGLDAKHRQQLNFPHGASAVAFDPTGGRVLLGGTAAGPAYLRDAAPLADFEPGRHVGPGPVAFRPDGTPVQLVGPTRERPTLRLCDPRRPDPLAEFPLPLAGAVGVSTALSADGTHVAASITYAGEKGGKTLVWAVPGGAKAKAAPAHDWPGAAAALAFSPDNAHLAAGTADGRVTVRALAGGDPVAFREAALPVESLAFGRNFWAGDGTPKPDAPAAARWLLAVGTKGARLSVWKLHPLERVNHFRGSNHEVSAIAFSPDGATVASVGRRPPILWDVATGRLLLRLWTNRNVFTGVAFSPDGGRVATTTIPVFPNEKGGLDLYDLDDGRGIRTYRGLSAQVERVWLSPSRKVVAALTSDWQLGVWDAATGRLRHVFDAPDGAFADNAAVVFGKDEADVLYCSGKRAVRWDVATGRRLNAWALPFPGLVDRLALLPDGRWLLFRAEREPQGWVCRGRELKADDTFAELYALPGFPRGVSRADLSADGKLLTVDGGSPAGRAVKLFDGTTGKELVVPGFPPVGPAGFLRITPSGNRVLLYQDDRLTVIEMPGGKNLGTHAHPRQGVNDAGTHQADAENGVTVTRVGSAAVVLRLDPDADHTRNSENPFSRDGGAVAWGRPDGTVLVADLAEVLKRVGPFQTR